jgi:hypothetical protein
MVARPTIAARKQYNLSRIYVPHTRAIISVIKPSRAVDYTNPKALIPVELVIGALELRSSASPLVIELKAFQSPPSFMSQRDRFLSVGCSI